MKKKITCILGGILLCTTLVGCESWNRTKKDFSSNIKGLNRTVKVYSQDGKLIKEYKGKLDVEVNQYGNKVKFDLDGKRVIINNAIVISEEE